MSTKKAAPPKPNSSPSASASSAIESASNVLREHAENQFRGELDALANSDTKPKPPRWKLSPWALLRGPRKALGPRRTLVTFVTITPHDPSSLPTRAGI